MTPAQRKILELVKQPRTFTELKKLTGLSDAGLYKALKSLESQNYIKKTEMGYIITPDGMRSLGYSVLKFSGITIIYENVEREEVMKLLDALKSIKDKPNFSIYIYKDEEEEKMLEEFTRIFTITLLASDDLNK